MTAITSSINRTNFEQISIKNSLKTKIHELHAYQTTLLQKISNLNEALHVNSNKIKETRKELKILWQQRSNLENSIINNEKLHLMNREIVQDTINHLTIKILSIKIARATLDESCILLISKKLEKTRNFIMNESYNVVDEISFLGSKLSDINMSA